MTVMDNPKDVVDKTKEINSRDKIEPRDDRDSGLDSTSDAGSSGEDEVLNDLNNPEGLDGTSQVNPAMPPSPYKTGEDSSDSYILPMFHSKGADLDESIPDDLESKSEYFQNLVKGMTETAEFNQDLDHPPEWLDLDKFRRGQKFACENDYAICLSEMMSLILLFSAPSALQPLMYTGKSDTPFRAFQRYISTVNRLRSWYGGELWCDEETDAKKNIRYVNHIHKSVYYKLRQTGPGQSISLGNPDEVALWCTLTRELREEFRRVIPPRGPYPRKPVGKVWFNQMDMAFTQWAFVGLMVTYPTHFGLFHASEEDLENFLYMWRGLGYLLGIKDEYNFCNAGLKEVRQRTLDYIEYAVKPNLRDVDENWEHMSRCLVTGISFYVPGTTFESSLLYLFKVIDLDVPILWKNTSYRHYIEFGFLRTVNFLQRIPGMTRLFNRALQRFITRANTVPEVTLQRWEQIEYEYMKQPGKQQLHT